MSNVVLLTTGYDRTIRHWDATTGVCTQIIKVEDANTSQAERFTVNKLEITHDKKYFAAASYGKIWLYDINHDKPISTYEGHVGNVNSVGFHKDSYWMYSGGDDGKVKVWDVRTRTCSRTFHSPGGINTVALHPTHGELISGDNSGHIRVWELGKGPCSTELVPAPNKPVRSITISPDGKCFVAASNRDTCFCWRIAAGTGSSHASEFRPLQRLPAHKDAYILKAAISPDNQLLATCSSDHTVKIWRFKGDNWTYERTLPGPVDPVLYHNRAQPEHPHNKWVWDCVWSVDAAYLVTACSDYVARLWDVGNPETGGTLLKTYMGHTKPCVAVALNDSFTDSVPDAAVVMDG